MKDAIIKNLRTKREKCPNMAFLWSVFPPNCNEYGDLLRNLCIQSNGKLLTRKKLRIWTLFTQSGHKSFIRLDLKYGDIFFNQAHNKLFHGNLKSVQ